MSFHPERLLPELQGLPAEERAWVGLSGGVDSVVLLTVLARLRGRLSFELRAVHVNHGLHPRSGDWQRQCGELCRVLDVPLESRRVRVEPRPGESLEAVARDARYAVFEELLGQGGLLLLAHHEDDQAETFLLQALRGAGVRGLASMPGQAVFSGGTLARPLLGFSREELKAWAEAEHLSWVEDPSNADTGFDRNYLRHEVMPLLKQRWPGAAATLSRGARLAAEADGLLQGMAAEDYARAGGGVTLPLEFLVSLPEARQRNLLRFWLHQRGLPLPAAQKLDELLRQLGAAEDRNPCVDWAGAEVRRYRQQLYAQPPFPPSPGGFHLRPGEEHSLGAGLGVLRLVPAAGEGIRAALCGPTGLSVGFRSGGEDCRPAGRAHHRPLKKWLQDLHVVPWLRDRLPLIHADGELLAVAGLFVCEPHAAKAGEAGLRIEWREAPALH